MKLAAIYNVWDGVELLRGSMNCLKDHVDLFIIVHQNVSNFGEQYDPEPEMDLSGFNVIKIKYTPEKIAGAFNESKKRNIGLDFARENDCSHFLHIDCDEYYQDFGKAKQQYIDSGQRGSVCRLITYFKDPTYRFESPDGYFVPFIHELNSTTTSGQHRYPFYVEPTRRINELDVAELDTIMHHFSWIRNDIERKVRNSSAKVNIEKSTLLHDHMIIGQDASPEGFFVKDFGKKITVVDNYFNIPYSTDKVLK